MVTKIDPPTNSPIQRVDLSGNADGIAAGLGGVWITDSTTGTVTVLDPISGEITGSSRVGVHPVQAVVGLGAAWVANEGNGTISRIDATTLQVTTIRVGAPVTAIVPDAVTGRLWVAVAELSPALSEKSWRSYSAAFLEWRKDPLRRDELRARASRR